MALEDRVLGSRGSISSRTVSGTDDGYWETPTHNDLFTNVGEFLILGGTDVSTVAHNVFVSFPNLQFPKDATINSASVTLSGNRESGLDVYVYGSLDDPPKNYEEAEALNLTSEYVLWTSGGTTPDLTAIVQELANDSRWNIGSRITFAFKLIVTGTTQHWYIISTDTENEDFWPLLTLEWERSSQVISLGDSFNVKGDFKRSINDNVSIGDTFNIFRYSHYKSVIDNPHLSPIRIAKIELPGKTLYLCDRLWGSVGEECLYEDQLFEPIILNWDNIAVGEIDPVDTTVSPATMSFAVDNNTPVGGSDSFGELFKIYDPYYAKITITEFFDADLPTDGIEIFEGYIESANVVSGGSVQIACSGFELSISNKFDHEIVDIDTYPNADPNDIGKMLPQVYGSAERVPFRAVDIGAYSTLIADISDIVTTIEVTNAENFASTGTIQIDAEKISYTGKTDNQLTGCTRGAESTTAVTHNSGTYVVKAILVEADYFFYIIGHAVKSITTVYMDNVRQLPANYTAYTGKSGNYHADYNGYACIMFKNLSSTQTMGTVSADIEGWQDDASGSYTGTANALIESPEAIIKHILLSRCGLSAASINPSSYAAAKAEYADMEWAEPW